MQQLTINFDGFAGQALQTIDAGTATRCSESKECSQRGNVLSPLWDWSVPAVGTLKEQAARRWAAVVAWLRGAAEVVAIVLYFPLLMAVCFGMMFLAAVLQGGAA